MSRPRPATAGVMVLTLVRKLSISAPLEREVPTAPVSVVTGVFD
jgi:hypothetical protein